MVFQRISKAGVLPAVGMLLSIGCIKNVQDRMAARSSKKAPEQNKAAARQIYQHVLNSQSMDSLEVYFDFDLTSHFYGPASTPGIESFRQGLVGMRTAFPDLHGDIETLVAEGDQVVARVKLTGTHRGEYMGFPATGKKFSVESVDYMRISDSKCVEFYSSVDNLKILSQLGYRMPVKTRKRN